MNATIVRFRPRRRACDLCGYGFNPTRTSTRLCHRCWAWTRAAWHQRRMAVLLEGVRG